MCVCASTLRYACVCACCAMLRACTRVCYVVDDVRRAWFSLSLTLCRWCCLHLGESVPLSSWIRIWSACDDTQSGQHHQHHRRSAPRRRRRRRHSSEHFVTVPACWACVCVCLCASDRAFELTPCTPNEHIWHTCCLYLFDAAEAVKRIRFDHVFRKSFLIRTVCTVDAVANVCNCAVHVYVCALGGGSWTHVVSVNYAAKTQPCGCVNGTHVDATKKNVVDIYAVPYHGVRAVQLHFIKMLRNMIHKYNIITRTNNSLLFCAHDTRPAEFWEIVCAQILC